MTSRSGFSPRTDPQGGAQITPLYSAAVIGARVQALADKIASRPPSSEEPLVLVGLLRGAIPFLTDLSRALEERGIALAIDYVRAASYVAGTTSCGAVALEGRLSIPLYGRDVLIVDDILDTGLTLAAVLSAFAGERPRRLATCVLLDKHARRVNALRADFVGFPCPDSFVVGYGMDLDGRFRELPFIGTIASL
jgi:hypoxanthine phosphoribosyltransferase